MICDLSNLFPKFCREHHFSKFWMPWPPWQGHHSWSKHVTEKSESAIQVAIMRPRMWSFQEKVCYTFKRNKFLKDTICVNLEELKTSKSQMNAAAFLHPNINESGLVTKKGKLLLTSVQLQVLVVFRWIPCSLWTADVQTCHSERSSLDFWCHWLGRVHLSNIQCTLHNMLNFCWLLRWQFT